MAEEKKGLSWRTPEHEHSHKDPDWFWAVGIIATSIAVISILSNNILFALFVLIGILTLFMHAIKKPELIRINIDHKGVSADNVFFPYEDLESFRVFRDDEHPFILFTSKKLFTPYIVIPLGTEMDADKINHVRSYLSNHVSEKKLEVPISHTLAKYIGL